MLSFLRSIRLLPLGIVSVCLLSLGPPRPAASQVEVVPVDIDDLPEEPRGAPLGLGFRIRSGAVQQFDTKVNGGGNFGSTRATVDGSVRYSWAKGSFAGISVGYAFDDYRFSDSVTIGGLAPWGSVHGLRVSFPLFYRLSPRWQMLVIPSLRFTAESADDWGDGFRGGGVFGVSYRFSRRLIIGPGVGVLSQIEDNPSVFPVLVIDWKPIDRLRIQTGRGLGATQGPGILATWKFSKWLRTSVAARYQRLRFRLRPDAAAPSGVGEDRAYSFVGGLDWGLPFAQIAIIAGAEFAGELRLEDANGVRIAKRKYATAPFVGLTLRGSF